MAKSLITTSMPSNNNKIFQVYCRFRPLNTREQHLGKDDEQLTCHVPPLIQIESRQCLTFDGRPYLFDGIYDASCTQAVFFTETVALQVNQFMSEYNDLTILTYGQTSSGKTWTIDGSFYNNDDLSPTASHENGDEHGILPRVLKYICSACHDDSKTKNVIRIAFYEIYCEKIIDLLALTTNTLAPKEIKLFEDKNNDRIELRGLTWLDLTGNDDGYQSIKSSLLAARSHRHFASTEMNTRSSRSHAILDICVRMTGTTKANVQEKHLRIIDLAGSERLAKTQSRGQVMREGIKINESLMYLKRLIDFLAESKDKENKETPSNRKTRYSSSAVGLDYRSTKLTRLLFSAFRTGRSRVILILCCSPSRDNINETNNTLEFGSNAKLIRTQLRQMQKRNSERKNAIELDNMAKYDAEMQLDLKTKNQLIETYCGKITEYEASVCALQKQLALALAQLERRNDDKMLTTDSLNSMTIPDAGTTKRHSEDCLQEEIRFKKEEEERKKIEMENEALMKRLHLFEKAYGRSCETVKIQEDIIRRNTQDIMEMQNEINFFYKFKKDLKKMFSEDE